MKESLEEVKNIYRHCYKIVGGTVIILLFLYLFVNSGKEIKNDVDFINHAEIGRGFITARGFKPGKCDNQVCEDDIDLATYTFNSQTSNKMYEGDSVITHELFENVHSDNLPYPVDIEYLSHNPNKNRIYGTGLRTYYEIAKYYWFGGLILIVFGGVGFYLLGNGIKFVSKYSYNPTRPLFHSFGILFSIPLSLFFAYLFGLTMRLLLAKYIYNSIVFGIVGMFIFLAFWMLILYWLVKIREKHFEESLQNKETL